MVYTPNSQQQTLTEAELKAKFKTRELFSFAGHLARKAAPKSYMAKKKPTYFLNILGFFSGSLLRILAGFMAVSVFLTGIFFGSSLAGAGLAVLLLVALEYLQIRNATELFETWFSESRVVASCVVYGLIFSGATAVLAFSGVDDTIKFVSEKVSPFHFDETAVNPLLRRDIDQADADAKEFFTARSWKGKLDIKDARRYEQLKNHANDLRKQYREEVGSARLAAKAEHDGLVSSKNQNDADNRFYLTLLILLTELLFWMAFYHKERYEFLAAKELELMGHIQKTTPTLPIIPQTPAQPLNASRYPQAADLTNSGFQ